MKLFGLAILLAAVPAFGQGYLPDKPVPTAQASVPVRVVTAPFRATGSTVKDVVTFKDKQFSAAALYYIGAYGTDMGSTAWRFQQCSKVFPVAGPNELNCTENGGLFNNTRKIGRMTAAYGSIALGVIVISHEWKNRVHNRWLRAIWPVEMLDRGSLHLKGAIGNLETPIPQAETPAPPPHVPPIRRR